MEKEGISSISPLKKDLWAKMLKLRTGAEVSYYYAKGKDIAAYSTDDVYLAKFVYDEEKKKYKCQIDDSFKRVNTSKIKEKMTGAKTIDTSRIKEKMTGAKAVVIKGIIFILVTGTITASIGLIYNNVVIKNREDEEQIYLDDISADFSYVPQEVIFSWVKYVQAKLIDNYNSIEDNDEKVAIETFLINNIDPFIEAIKNDDGKREYGTNTLERFENDQEQIAFSRRAEELTKKMVENKMVGKDKELLFKNTPYALFETDGDLALIPASSLNVDLNELPVGTIIVERQLLIPIYTADELLFGKGGKKLQKDLPAE